jgi:uncharacterized membrane protein YhaH (DUF805 family)
MEWMILPLKRYAQFSGRSRRKEYWMFALLFWILFFMAGVIDTMMGFGTVSTGDATDRILYSWNVENGPVMIVLSLAFLIPHLAVSVRRLHDTDRSAWWLLILLLPLIGLVTMIVFMCLDGTIGPNRYGPDPKAGEPGHPPVGAVPAS